MTTLRYQGNPPPSRPNRPDSTQNRSRPVLASPSSDLPPGLPPQLLELSDDERSKVLALDHRVLSKLYDVLALPSDIRGRVIPLRYDGKQPFTYRDKVPRRGDSETYLAEGGFRWNKRYGVTDPMPAVTDYTIIEWAVRFRSSNWAVRTGTIPNLDARCLVVADVDYPELLNVTEHDLFFMSPRLTRRQTERGIHVYAYSETPTKTDPKPKWGEVKAEGQFVMLHLRYSWKETPYLGTLWPDSFLDTLLPYDGNVRRTDIRGGVTRSVAVQPRRGCAGTAERTLFSLLKAGTRRIATGQASPRVCRRVAIRGFPLPRVPRARTRTASKSRRLPMRGSATCG